MHTHAHLNTLRLQDLQAEAERNRLAKLAKATHANSKPRRVFGLRALFQRLRPA